MKKTLLALAALLTATLSMSAADEACVISKSLTGAKKSESVTINSESYTVVYAYTLIATQNTSVSYGRTEFTIPYSELTTNIGGGVEVTNTNAASLVYYPNTSGEYAVYGNYWFNESGQGCLAYGNASTTPWYIQQVQDTDGNGTADNVAIWAGTLGYGTVGKVYTTTYYMLDTTNKKAIQFDVTLNLINAIAQINDEATATSWTSSSSTSTIVAGSYVQLDGVKVTFGSNVDGSTTWSYNSDNTGMIPTQMPSTDGTSSTLITSFSETSPFGTLPTKGNFFKIEPTANSTITITCKPSTQAVQKLVFVTMDSSDPTKIAKASVITHNNGTSFSYNVSAGRTYYFFQLAYRGKLTGYRFTMRGISVAAREDYPSNIPLSSINVVDSKDVTIDYYSVADDYATHTAENITVGDIATAIGVSAENFALGMIYAKNSDGTVLYSKKSASDSKGFWFAKSNNEPGECYNQTSWNGSVERIFVNVDGIATGSSTCSISYGQRPSSCLNGEYNTKIYVLAPCNDDNEWNAYLVNLTFNLHPSVLNEDANYSIEATGITALTLKRTIGKDKWSTIVLPVALTSDQLTATFGANVKVAELTSATADELTFTSVTATEANKPYMIYVDQDFSEATITGITVVDDTPSQTVDIATFTGSYDASTDIPEGSYFASNNQIVKAGSGCTMKGTRAYFTVTSEARALRFNIDGNTTTAISEIENSKSQSSNLYDLQGRQVNGPMKGLYIHNGKKIIVK